MLEKAVLLTEQIDQQSIIELQQKVIELNNWIAFRLLFSRSSTPTLRRFRGPAQHGSTSQAYWIVQKEHRSRNFIINGVQEKDKENVQNAMNIILQEIEE